MGIYLGANALGGGGGGDAIPIGGIRYFIPPFGTTFTSGQEVYTDPDDNTVWLRSGAIITSAGTGALDASLYANIIGGIADSGENAQLFSGTSTSWIVDSRRAFAYLGDGIIGAIGFDANTVSGWAIVDASTRAGIAHENFITWGLFGGNTDGTNGSTSVAVTDERFTFKGAAGNDTHIFVGNRSASESFGWNSDGSGIYHAAKLNRSIFDNTLTGAELSSNSFTYRVPSAYNGVLGRYNDPKLWMAITNSGEANERHWFIQQGSTTISEFTYNGSTPHDGEPWTATGNSITIPVAPGSDGTIEHFSITGIGNILYVSSKDAFLRTYDATTYTQINQYLQPQLGYIPIPADQSQSGELELWNWYAVGSTDITINSSNFSLTAPYIGTYGSGSPIVLTNYAGTAASDGRDQTETDIYLWIRIA